MAQDGFGLLQPAHGFREQRRGDRIATLRERGGIADLLQAIGGEHAERAFDQILAQPIALRSCLPGGMQLAWGCGLDRRIQQPGPGLHRQLLTRLLAPVGLRDGQQPTHALRMQPARHRAIGVHHERGAVAVVLQRRIGRHAARAGYRSGDRRVGKGNQTRLRKPGCRVRCERLRGAGAEAFAQRSEVARFGQHVRVAAPLAGAIEQAQVRMQMRVDRFRCEIGRGNLNAGQPLEEPGQRALDAVGLRYRMRLGKGPGEVRRRHEIAPQLFGQRPDQRRRLVLDEARR